MVEKSDNRGSAAPESGTDTIESLGLDGIEIQMQQYEDIEAHYNANGVALNKKIKKHTSENIEGWERNTADFNTDNMFLNKYMPSYLSLNKLQPYFDVTTK